MDMFGNGKQDDQAQQGDQQAQATSSAQSEPAMGQPFNMTSQAPDLTTTPSEPTSAPVAEDQVVAPTQDADSTPTDTPPATDDNIGEEPPADAPLPPVEEEETDQADQPATDGNNDDLTAIKQQALQQLSPLVGHLDQTPEEKFRTTMMMIQAADDQSLIKSAYEAAEKINDEKERAQALLDVINEINYFTQQKKDS